MLDEIVKKYFLSENKLFLEINKKGPMSNH